MAPADTHPVLKEIRLQEAHREIITKYEADNPNFRNQNLVLWPALGYKKTPATTKLGHNIDLALIFSWHPSQKPAKAFDLVLTINGKISGNTRVAINGGPQIIKSANLPQDRIVMLVRLVNSGSPDVPWGLKDEVKWTLHVEWTPPGGSKSQHDYAFQTPIELYGVISNIGPLYDRGIPLDLLRMFVLPVSKVTTIKTLPDWIKWVVERCHASRVDTDSKVPLQERLHAFRYDVWTGASKYRSNDSFAVDDWIQDLEHEGAWNILNCHDQAAVVQVMISLGVPSPLVSYVFKKPFGYIKTLDLVGWGETNNPFFDAVVKNKKLAEDDLVLKGYQFGNHGFVAYKKDNSSDWLILDACAGPAIGSQSLSEYLKSTIDNEKNKTLQNPRNGYKEVSQIFTTAEFSAGINQLNNASSGNTKDTFRGVGDNTFTNDDKSEWAKIIERARADKSLTEQYFKIDMNKVFREFGQAVEITLPEEVSQGLVYRNSRPRTMTSGNDVLFYQRGLDIAGKDSVRPLVTFSVRALPTAAKAMEEAESFINSLSRVTDNSFLKSGDTSKPEVHVHVEGKEPSRFNLFVYGNLVIYLDGAIERSLMKQLAIKTVGMLSSASGEVPTIDDDIQIEPLKAEDLPMKTGDVFHINVACKDGENMDVYSDSNLIFHTTKSRPSDPGGSQGKWRFNFFVVRTSYVGGNGKTVSPGKDTLQFIAFHKLTGVPGVKSIDIPLA